MATTAPLQATMSSKGQLTVPAALRVEFGLSEGVKVTFYSDGKQLVLKPESPVSGYFGALKHLGDIDTTIPKEPDRF